MSDFNYINSLWRRIALLPTWHTPCFFPSQFAEPVSLGDGGRVRTPVRVRELIRDQDGQGLIEFVMLLTISIALCYVLVKGCSKIVSVLYGKLEGEVSRPSHYR